MKHSFEKSKVYHSVYVNNNGNEQHLEKGASSVNKDGKKEVRGFKTTDNGNIEELSVKEANKFIQQSKNMVPLQNVMPSIDNLIDRFKNHRIQSGRIQSGRIQSRTPTPHPLFKKLKNTLSKRKKSSKQKKHKLKKVRFEDSNNISQLFDRTEPPSIVRIKTQNTHNTQNTRNAHNTQKKRKRKRSSTKKKRKAKKAKKQKNKINNRKQPE